MENTTDTQRRQVELIDAPCEGEFNGSPLCKIPVGAKGYAFVFGIAKAKAILENLDYIRSFVAKHARG